MIVRFEIEAQALELPQCLGFIVAIAMTNQSISFVPAGERIVRSAHVLKCLAAGE